MKRKPIRTRVCAALCATSFLLAAALTSCGGGSNVKASEKAVSIGKSAIAIADDYLDNNVSSDVAVSRLESLNEKMEYVDNLPEDTAEERAVRTADFSVSVSLTILCHDITMDSIDNGHYSQIKESRNKLAKEIGEKAR